jgi:hypothetical protein
MALDDQVALLANMVVVNDHRRHVSEAILLRCADAWRVVE